MQVEADDRGALDDIVALDTRNVLHVWQVKYAAHPDTPADAYTWDVLLAQSEGRRGRVTQSLIQKWAYSLEHLRTDYSEINACLISNRSAAPEIRSVMSSEGLVDFDAIAESAAHRLTFQLGGESQARIFFSQFHFHLNQPNLDELQEGVRTRFRRLGGTDEGWWNLKEEVSSWVNFKDAPSPGGFFTLQDIKEAAYWHKLEPLPQEFVLPRDYVLPSHTFHTNLISQILELRQGCLVLTASPGSGKSTYASYLYRRLQRQGIPAVRHHYFLSLGELSSILRLEHARAAESLMADLERFHAQALGETVSHNPSPNDLGMWIEACGAYYAAQNTALVVIIDGLDHVWREHRQIEELQALLKFLLPAAPGVVVLLVTQPLDESLLPPFVLRAAPPSTWLNLPLLDQDAVQAWLRRHQRELALPNASFEFALERLSEAMYQKSQGHPLHLRYTFAAMQEQQIAMTPEMVHMLPGCAHADITSYYEELWRAVPKESRQILCLLAVCPFSWPRAGILDCLDPQGDRRSDVISALSKVQHLLIRDSLGLHPFHSSLLQFLAAQPSYLDHEMPIRRKALVWLQSLAPEFLQWSFEWLLKAQMGDEQSLRDGPTRRWAVEASARRRPSEEVEIILSQSLSLALRSQDLPRAIAVGLLKDYYGNAVESYEVLQEQLLAPQVIADQHRFLLSYLTVHLEQLMDEEVATVAEIFSKEGDYAGVQRCSQLLMKRVRNNRQRIPQEHRLHRNANVAPLVKVFALLDDYATESIVNLCLRNRSGGYAQIMLNILGTSLLQRKDLPRMRDLLKPSLLTLLTETERAIVLRPAVLLALEEHIPFLEVLSKAGCDDDTFVALYRALRAPEDSSGTTVWFPDARLLQMQRPEVYEQRAEVQTCMYQAFFSFLANELLGSGDRNYAWLQTVEARGWHVHFLRQLSTIAKELVPSLLEGYHLGFGRFYELLAALPFRPGRPFEVEWEYSHAVLDIIPDLGLDLYLVANAGRKIPPIMPEDLLPMLNSEYGELETWLWAYANRGRLWLNDDAVSLLIQKHYDIDVSERRSFEERARSYAAIASVTALHRQNVQTEDALIRAGENMIAHAYHKDMLFFSVLESIQVYHRHACSIPSVDGAKCICAQWVTSLVPAISCIRDYTDGDHTRYAPEKLAEVLSEISPDALLNYYKWQHKYGDDQDAVTTLHAFLKVADLNNPIHRAITDEATDAFSQHLLQKRNMDANGHSQAELGETDGQSENFQEHFLSTQGQENQPPFDAKRQRGLPRPASYPPARFEDYLNALQHKLFSYEKAFVVNWITYWSRKGKQEEVYLAVSRMLERGKYLDVYDEMFDLATALYGWERAYPWLIKAQVEGNGWWQYISSDEDVQRRWNLVRDHFQGRWYDFLRDSLEEAGRVRRWGLTLSHGMWVRLVQYVLIMQQPVLAKHMLEEMVKVSLALVPLGNPEYSARIDR